MKQRWKSILKECAGILFLIIIFVTFATDDMVLSVGGSLSSFWHRYLEPELWLINSSIFLAVYFLLSYFEKINPREMYYTIGVGVSITIVWFSVMALLAAFVWTAVIESLFFKIVVLVLSFLVFLFLIYVCIYRGVAIYKRGKIRIFQFKIKTYHTDKIDDFFMEYLEKTCRVHIIVCGIDHVFTIPTGSARMCEKRFHSQAFLCHVKNDKG